MKPVSQIVFDDILGDCFRACVASIFEFPTEGMPNFWEQTQDVDEFWKMNNEWLMKNKGYRLLNCVFSNEHKHLIDDVLCIACAKSPRGDTDHAVVWCSGEIAHDPHPSGAGLAEDPDTFTIFVPIDPNKANKEKL